MCTLGLCRVVRVLWPFVVCLILLWSKTDLYWAFCWTQNDNNDKTSYCFKLRLYIQTVTLGSTWVLSRDQGEQTNPCYLWMERVGRTRRIIHTLYATLEVHTQECFSQRQIRTQVWVWSLFRDLRGVEDESKIDRSLEVAKKRQSRTDGDNLMPGSEPKEKTTFAWQSWSFEYMCTSRSISNIWSNWLWMILLVSRTISQRNAR